MAGKHRGAMGNVKFSNFYNNTVEVVWDLFLIMYFKFFAINILFLYK